MCDDHRTCGIGNITLFNFHDTTYNHETKESYTFVYWWPNTINQHAVEFASHEPCRNRDITFFIRHATIVSCDNCRK